MRRLIPFLLFCLACSGSATGTDPSKHAPIVSVRVFPAQAERGSQISIVITSQYADAGCKVDGTSMPDSFTITPTSSVSGFVSCVGDGGTTNVPYSVTITEPPSVSIQVYGVNGSGEVSVAGITAIYSSGTWKDSLTLGTTGASTLPVSSSVRAQFGDSLCVKLVDRRPNPTLKTSVGCMPKVPALAGEVLSFVLGPKVWSIVSGSYAGNQLPISFVSANAPAGDGLPFYFNSTVNWYWPSFPIVWAMDRSQGPISSADSVNFSAGLDRLMSKLGPPFSARAGMMGQDVILNTKGVRVFMDTNLVRAAAAGSGGGLSGSGILHLGFVTWKSSEAFLFTGTVEHEFIHVLGFGHTCSWFTVMYTNCPPGPGSEGPSIGDVAYIQYFYAIRGMQTSKQTKFGLDGLYRAELSDGQGLRALTAGPPWSNTSRSANGNFLFNN